MKFEPETVKLIQNRVSLSYDGLFRSSPFNVHDPGITHKYKTSGIHAL